MELATYSYELEIEYIEKKQIRTDRRRTESRREKKKDLHDVEDILNEGQPHNGTRSLL